MLAGEGMLDACGAVLSRLRFAVLAGGSLRRGYLSQDEIGGARKG